MTFIIKIYVDYYISIMFNINIISLALILFYTVFSDPKVCDGNRFKFISSYALGRQSDLTSTFVQLQPIVQVDPITYKDQLFRTYTIFPLEMKFSYLQSKQSAKFSGVNVLQISGGTLRIQYDFKWQKKQLTSAINGTGKGVVTTNGIVFKKQIFLNDSKQLQWNLTYTEPINISNSLTLSQISPYKAADYDVINKMLNQLPNNETTVKMNLIKALNVHYVQTLRNIVHNSNDTWKESKFIQYTYTDYRGEFIVNYDNYIVNIYLNEQGLQLLLTQTIQNYSQFECGEKVPDKPDDEKVYGGLQQFVSNSFIKSTLKYAISKGFLDVVMTQQNWQSPAFQFFVGDLHEIIPITKNLSTLETIVGRCKALNDKSFNFSQKTNSTYEVSVNFTCQFTFKDINFLTIQIPVIYEVSPKLTSDHLDFTISSIKGTPTFDSKEGYEIKNMDLALFMVQQTLNMAKNSKVLGSGYKTTLRKYPNLKVRDTYLFMYDSSVKPSKTLIDL